MGIFTFVHLLLDLIEVALPRTSLVEADNLATLVHLVLSTHVVHDCNTMSRLTNKRKPESGLAWPPPQWNVREATGP